MNGPGGPGRTKGRALHAALLLACCATIGSPASASATDPLTDNFAERVLVAHNKERDAVGVPRLVWSETLAAHARAWADHLARAGYLAHAEDDPKARPEGENLWTGTRRSYSVEQMVGLWLDERSRFKAGRFPDVSTTGEVDDIGHYTQLIWRATRTIGCAIADNGEDEYLVCRYRDAGNVIGEKPL